jgi:hypothetical protein
MKIRKRMGMPKVRVASSFAAYGANEHAVRTELVETRSELEHVSMTGKIASRDGNADLESRQVDGGESTPVKFAERLALLSARSNA